MNSGRSGKLFVLVLVWLAIIGGGAALYKFKFASAETLQVPFILWGGDVATFHANRGVETEKGSLFEKHGLNIKLVDGNDFDKQVEDYLNGNSNFLRGTMSMLGQASERLSREAGAQPVVFLQMTWSAGDHLVARSNIKTLADLKGKRIALQKRGPHVGMLHDILTTAELGWNEKAAGRKGFIHVVWTDDVDGPNGPAGKLKVDSSIDACFAITPEKDDLVGDPPRKAGAVPGAHVLISTEHMSRSIADVYACRKDFYDGNSAVIQKFTAAYLKACEELLTMKKQNGAEYRALLKLSQKIFTEKKIPTEDDARGLVDDAGFVGLTGNESFFSDRGNLSGFRAKMKAAQDVAMALGDAQSRHAFASADLDYAKIEKLSELVVLRGAKERFPSDIKALPNSTVFSFDVHFDARQEEFNAEAHEDSFQRALEQASLFGNCLIKMRGHTDALSVLAIYVEAGVGAKKLEPQGDVLATFKSDDKKRDISVHGAYGFKDGGMLDLRDPKTCGRITELLTKDDFGNPNIMKQVDKLAMLSAKRTNNAKSELIKYAAKHKINLESNQIQAEGVGMREPVNPLQLKELDVTANRRVEIRIERVKVSDLNPGGIDR